PFLQCFTERVACDRRQLSGVLEGKKPAAGGQAIDALPGRAAIVARAAPSSLVRYPAEELALCVLAAPLVPIVAYHRDEMRPRQADDFRIGEGEHTARHAVVSGTTQRIAVHLPEQN